MTSQVKLVQLGEWAGTAAEVAGGDYSGPLTLSSTNSQTAPVTGSGTTQTSSTLSTGLAGATYQITNDIAHFNVVGTTYNTAQLTNQGSAFITVFNSGAQTLLVYPPFGAAINYGTVNAAFGVQAGKSTTFITPDGMTWFAQHAG
jgi:hypothetical protein